MESQHMFLDSADRIQGSSDVLTQFHDLDTSAQRSGIQNLILPSRYHTTTSTRIVISMGVAGLNDTTGALLIKVAFENILMEMMVSASLVTWMLPQDSLHSLSSRHFNWRPQESRKVLIFN